MRLAWLLEQFRHIASPRAGLQQMNEFGSQPAIEPLPGLIRQSEKLDTKLMALHPFDRPKFNGQRVGLVRKQDAHAHITATKDLSIAQDRTPAERQVGQDPFADKRRPAENDRIMQLVSGINPAIGKRRHHDLRTVGL